jgi:NADH-quinone oxidoreductase subunit J
MQIEIKTVDVVLLVAMLVAATWTVMAARLLRSIIGLAITSVLLTAIMFRLNSPWAAVFELSVCAGLISAIFLSTISLTRRLTADELAVRQKQRLYRYWYLPMIMIVAGIVLYGLHFHFAIPAHGATEQDVRQVLWGARHLDLIGQAAVLLGGAFGVVVLFKEWKHD